MERFTKLSYSAIISHAAADWLIANSPREFPLRVARAERDLERLEDRIGSVRILYQDQFDGLSDMAIRWSRPASELTIDWFSIPEGIRIATAVVPIFDTRGCGDQVDLTSWNNATRWVRVWTRPRWFRCHKCGRRTALSRRGVGTAGVGIYCPQCWCSVGEELSKLNA